MKHTLALIVVLGAASLAFGQDADKSARHVIGLDAAKKNAMGSLKIHDGVMEFTTGKAGETASKVPISSVDDVFIGTEQTQVRGKTATVVKTAGHAAPYGSGRALSLMMRNKVDILTVSFHDNDGSQHGAIFALPIGQAEGMRTQLVQAGVHASPIE